MKRVIIATFDPETNPKDAAYAAISQLNSDITAIGNVVKGCKKQYDEHIDDDEVMLKIIDKLGPMQQVIDQIRDIYFNK